MRNAKLGSDTPQYWEGVSAAVVSKQLRNASPMLPRLLAAR